MSKSYPSVKLVYCTQRGNRSEAKMKGEAVNENIQDAIEALLYAMSTGEKMPPEALLEIRAARASGDVRNLVNALTG